MLKYIAGIITGTALTIIGWTQSVQAIQKVIVTLVTLVKAIILEVGL